MYPVFSFESIEIAERKAFPDRQRAIQQVSLLFQDREARVNFFLFDPAGAEICLLRAVLDLLGHLAAEALESLRALPERHGCSARIGLFRPAAPEGANNPAPGRERRERGCFLFSMSTPPLGKKR